MPRETHTSSMSEHRHPVTATRDVARFEEGQRITWVSVGVNIVLTAMQLVVGFVAHSQSLIADAMHTLSDIVADAFVLFANRKGAEAADAWSPERIAGDPQGYLRNTDGQIGRQLEAARGRLSELQAKRA